MRSNHQKVNNGSIVERDWVTTNGLNILKFGGGRRVWYNSGNFVYTTSNVPTYHKKHKLTTEVKEWDWDSCKHSDTNDSTESTILFNTDDLRDFAYYGSCLELIRATIEDIISDFPASLTLTNERIYSLNDYTSEIDDRPTFRPTIGDASFDRKTGSWYYYDGNVWVKAVEVDNLVNGKVTITNGTVYHDRSDDELKIATIIDGELEFDPIGIPNNIFTTYYVRNLGKFYSYNYAGEEFHEDNTLVGIVDGLRVSNPFNVDLHHKRVFIDGEYNKLRFMSESWRDYGLMVNGEFEPITKFEIIDYKEDVYCNENNEGRKLKDINITTAKRTITIFGYYVNGNIYYTTNRNSNIQTLSIQPKQSIIDEYFRKLKGFKNLLLRRDTIPLYSNKFVTPMEYNMNIIYPLRTYTWPSNGYCIDVESEAFNGFISKLFELGSKFDEVWSDNLYRSMTHEAIKNFDWTYRRTYTDGDAQDNIDGGERMQKIIRVFGRAFDDVKHYIDNIKLVNSVSYDKLRNASDKSLAIKAELKGIDTLNLINKDIQLNTSISKEFLNDGVSKEVGINGKELPYKWFKTNDPKDITASQWNIEFLRRLNLSIKRIMQTKGTKQAVDMVFALFGFKNGIDYDLTEVAYFTEKPIPYNECVNGKIDGKEGYLGEDWTSTPLVNWDTIKSHKKGDLAVEINRNKDEQALYGHDLLSGIPLRQQILGRGNESFLVPYYDSSQLYDGRLVYQSFGGWGKFIGRGVNDSDVDGLHYSETLSYLKVVGTIGELLSINPFQLSDNVIYYVVNLNDYTEYDKFPPMNLKNGVTMSHYFILKDKGESNKLYAWRNIVVQPTLDSKGNLQKITNKDAFNDVFGVGAVHKWAYSKDDLEDGEDQLSTYEYAFSKMKYLDSILSTNIGNNPHVGYGSYDDGNRFIEFMKLPFKNIIDKNGLYNPGLLKLAKNYTFSDIGNEYVTDKIQIMNSRSGSKTDFIRYEVNGENITAKYSLSEPKDNVKNRWYINTKVLTITNKVRCENSYKCSNEIKDGDNVTYNVGDIIDTTTYNNLSEEQKKKFYQHNLFDEYFKDVMLPYIMQVIPSTTILKLKNFSE